MTGKQLLVAIVAVLTTALEVEGDYFPESMGYLALGSDMGKWELVRNTMMRLEFITIKGNTIKLLPKGRELAVKCKEALAKQNKTPA